MTSLPAWSAWRAGSPSSAFTIGIEEEFMLLDPRDWSLAFRSDEVIAGLGPALRDRVTPETHAAVMEVTTGVHRRVADAAAELAELRWKLSRALARHGLRAGVAGMHPSAVGSDTVVSTHPRYREIGASMRVLARREPTLATHVHVGIASPRAAVRLLNRLRVHLPLLLGLSANSPFWQGRATGFASTRTTVFDAFPRTGVARAFRDYADWVGRVDALLRSGAIADPSLLWWDARLQPRYGTVEVRIMDAQTTIADVAAVA
ncbi:MAG TPA: YbdK family carboxylate-amine ligase, partial [Solirubrobacteraceae bacterium]